MIQRVDQFIEKHQLMKKNSSVVVGVSGGPDSLALLHILNLLKEKYDIKIFAAHVDHMFRGEESKKEMEFVIDFCQKFNIPCCAKQINVPQIAKERRVNPQQAARESRYRFFKEVMDRQKADYLALAHHGDDQIETILMNLVRGTVGKRLAGIPVKRKFGPGQIIRPFLGVTKSDILQYCEKNQLNPRFDPSNEKDAYTRNRFRKYILPVIRQENEKVYDHFQYFSEIMMEDEQFLEELTKQHLNKIVIGKKDSEVTLHIEEFQKLPEPIKRRAIYVMMDELFGNKGVFSAIHIESVKNFLLNKRPSGFLHLPMGLKVMKSYHKCTFTFQSFIPERFYDELPVPGELKLPNGKKLKSETFYGVPTYKSDHIFYLPEKWFVPPLIVRNRKKGDRMTIKGMNGSKKVKDIFIDQKIPRQERDLLPIVENGDGQIIWIPLVKKSKFEQINVTNQSYIVLQYKEQ